MYISNFNDLNPFFFSLVFLYGGYFILFFSKTYKYLKMKAREKSKSGFPNTTSPKYFEHKTITYSLPIMDKTIEGLICTLEGLEKRTAELHQELEIAAKKREMYVLIFHCIHLVEYPSTNNSTIICMK